MALTAGTRLGPYEITAQIGVGGMGEVWCATDTNLGRQVAIKILPDAFAHDPERLARFEREAKTLASLNHPNIAQIYGLEKTDSIRALVMELVEGPTLADRIAQGPISVDEALPIAKQIADALEGAHERGIIHRDLKPANIKVRPDSTVKVLDFGLAKAMEPTSTITSSHSNSPTITTPAMTQMGMILGTAAYMSPEQAKGLPADKRCDVWAYGCVLYEMLTGRRAFEGEGVSETLARVIEREPSLSALPENIPPSILRLIRRALAKDPRKRLPDIAIARLEIDDAVARPQPATAHTHQRRWPRVIPWALAALSTAAALGLLWRTWPLSNGPIADVERLELPLQPGVELYTGSAQSFALSRDGMRLVYIGIAAGRRNLYVRQRGERDATILQVPAGAGALSECFFSWDGSAVGFISAAGVLGKVTLADRRVVILMERDVERLGAAWGPDDRITFVRDGTLWQIPASRPSAQPTQVTTIDSGRRELSHRWPTVVDNGARILFTVLSDNQREPASIWALSVEMGTRTLVEEAAAFPLYAASGHLLFFRGASLLARPFDLSRLRAAGAAVPVLDIASDAFGAPLVAISSTGTLVYTPPVQSRVVWVSRQGLEEPASNTARAYEFPRLLPNGTGIVIASNGDLLLEDLERHSVRQLASEETVKSYPALSSNGAQVVFRTPGGLRVIDVDKRDGRSEPISGTGPNDYPAGSFLRDGRLSFTRVSANTSGDAYVTSLPGGEPRAILNTRFFEGGFQFSTPDGRLAVFASDETGQMEVYVALGSDPGAKTPVSAPRGGTQPLWARNGRELFYRRGDQMRVVSVSTQGGTVKISDDHLLFERRYAFGSGLARPNYDVDLNDQRLLMVKDESDSGRLEVVLNWTEELKRLVPAN